VVDKTTKETAMKKLWFGMTIAAALMAPVYGQDPQPAPQPGRIQQRKENQQDRIAQGVKSGQLTAGETAHLENKEAKLNHEVRNDRKANGGTLTGQEKRQINRQQNQVSRNIYRDKHNGKNQAK
jgi:hypothetical protein